MQAGAWVTHKTAELFPGDEGAMRRVLFVDDEPTFLEGLQRMLRPQRHEWEVAFAPSGQCRASPYGGFTFRCHCL